MSKLLHYAYDTTNKTIKQDDLVRLLNSSWLKKEAGPNGFLFSQLTLNYYLDLEHRLGEKVLTTDEESLHHKSTGERKKLLLAYILKQKPDFLILDHPFDGLDVEFVSAFKEELNELAANTVIVQFYTRSIDVLPFCDNTLEFKDGVFQKAGKLVLEEVQINRVQEYQIPQALYSNYDLPDILIEFRDVTVSFGEKEVLQHINWKVKKGESWQLTGANGTGKTTLLSMITGDSVKGYGKDLYIFGFKKGSGESVWEIKKKIGYVTPVLTEHFDGMHSLSDMIVGGLYDSVGLYKRPTSMERSIAEDWINLIGLRPLRSSRFRDLSEVHKRLALIARAMIKNPPLLILDEPTLNLGDKDAALVVNLINTLTNNTETSILYVSHRQEPGLRITHVFELIKTTNGSLGKVKKMNKAV